MAENTQKLKFNADSILKSLPAGFTGVSVPKGTRIVHVQANPEQISPKLSKKTVKKLASELKLTVVTSYEDGSYYKLVDMDMVKAMRAEAKACLAVVKKFFSKYRNASLFDDPTCDTLKAMNDIIDNV